MPRTSACVIALTVMVAVMAQAAEPATLTLACAGTATTGNAKPEPISMGIIVNFTAGTVQGLDFMTRSIQGLIGPNLTESQSRGGRF
jgi:hypothetical protein